MVVRKCLRSRRVAFHLLGAGNGASRDGHAAGAGAGTLNNEGTEVVDLVALLDLESVVVAVGQRGRRSPDELAVACVGGQSLDILEVAGRTLAQDDAHGLCDVSILFAMLQCRTGYSRWWCRWSQR